MTPDIEVLRAVRDALKPDMFYDVLRGTGADRQKMTVRHQRGRAAREDQRPSISIEWIESAPFQDDQENTFVTSGEMAMEMTINLQIDVEPFADVEDPDAPEVYPDEIDEIGYEQATEIAYRCVDILQAEDGSFRETCDWASFDGIVPSPESTDDFVRVDVGLTLRYRVRSDRPSSLLRQGT